MHTLFKSIISITRWLTERVIFSIIIKFNTTLAINLIDVSIYAFFVSLFNINRISYKK